MPETLGLQEISDEELVRRFGAGDTIAFETIVHRFQDRVFRLATLWLFDPQQAEDATQEVFIRSYRGLRGFRFRSTTYTWIYRVTRNVCHEFNRKRRPEPLEEEPVDEDAQPERDTQRMLVARRLRTLMEDLPEKQRDVIILRLFEDLSVIETAQVMGCRSGTVKTLLHRAKRKLKLIIEDTELVL